MFVAHHHLVNQKTVLLYGEYDADGQLGTRIMEGRHLLHADHEPLSLFKKDSDWVSLNFQEAALRQQPPLKRRRRPCTLFMNTRLGICLFSITAHKRRHPIWFSPDHILHVTACGKQTDVHLTNGITIRVNRSATAFHHQLHIAQQLLRSLDRRRHRTLTFIVDRRQEQDLTIKEDREDYRLEG